MTADLFLTPEGCRYWVSEVMSRRYGETTPVARWSAKECEARRVLLRLAILLERRTWQE